jgi:hypothetical protein
MIRLKQAVPFRPFRVRLADGRTVDVLSEELILMLGTAVMLGIPPAGATEPFYERTVTVPLRDIVAAEPLDVPALAGT